MIGPQDIRVEHGQMPRHKLNQNVSVTVRPEIRSQPCSPVFSLPATVFSMGRME